MHANAEFRLRIANERIARAHRDADRARLAQEARRRHRSWLRSRTGRALIAAGRRLAAEQAPIPARSR